MRWRLTGGKQKLRKVVQNGLSVFAAVTVLRTDRQIHELHVEKETV